MKINNNKNYLNEIHHNQTQSLTTKGWTYPLSSGNFLPMFWDNLLHSTVRPPLDILPWVRIAFSLFPSSLSLSFFHFTSILLSCCISPSLPFIIHQFILLFLLWFLLYPFCTTHTLFVLSLFTSVQYPQITHTPLRISLLLNCSLFSTPSSLRFLLCPSVHIILLLDLPALYMVIYHGVALDYDIYPLLFSIHLLPVVSLFFVLVF